MKQNESPISGNVSALRNSPSTFEEWQQFAQTIERRAKALNDSVHERGWMLAKSVGIDRNMCCVHNAAIDDEMTGWCHKNPHRLKVAKRANHLLNDWTASHLAARIVNRAWNRMASKNGYAIIPL